MSTVEPPARASLLALLTMLCACTEVTIIASGGGGQGPAGGGGEDNPPPVVPCEQRPEADCVGGCVPLVDWSAVVGNAPPPPPGSPVESEPCCPECAQAPCNSCHMPLFKRCIPVDQCAAPQPPEDCGVPLYCDN